ncbi:MAG TPA: Tim44-like domain-containing protein [Rhodocyclaceae bacterium]|nr:Tim44-like domain-containing protein [Rhodocyclaceae bacterium]
MRNIALALFAAVIGIGLFAQDAEAARLGGSRSIGMNRSSTPVQKAAPAPTAPTPNAAPTVPAKPAATPQAPAPQPSGMSRWLGPIAGLAAGLGIAALLSHFGMGEGMANMLMILLLVMAAVFVFRLLFRKSQPSQHAAYAGGVGSTSEPMHFEPTAAPAIGGTAAATNVPAGFDSEGFLRQAKLNFIRLQAANDAGNLDDLKQFLAPEVFAEIQMQYEERGHAKQETDVQHLDAELLELVTESDRYIASVRFSGQIREQANAAAQPFAEIWHLTKPVAGGGWQVAGIQQIQ